MLVNHLTAVCVRGGRGAWVGVGGQNGIPPFLKRDINSFQTIVPCLDWNISLFNSPLFSQKSPDCSLLLWIIYFKENDKFYHYECVLCIYDMCFGADF